MGIKARCSNPIHDQARPTFGAAALFLGFLISSITPWASGGQSPEIGDNDFQISTHFGDVNYDPETVSPFADAGAAVAYNATEQEYLVVWEGGFGLSLCPVEEEIGIQRIDAATGEGLFPFGRRLSNSGPDCDDDHHARDPDVVWNAIENEYLVVWSGTDGGDLELTEKEIFAQRLDGAGAEIAAQLRISDMGGVGGDGVFYDARGPAVVWNAAANEYLVVWEGTDDVGGLVAFEYEIFGQRLNENGTEQGTNDFRISDMGGRGNSSFAGLLPAVAARGYSGELLVVWSGDDNEGSLDDDEYQIFGQLLRIVIFANGFESGDTTAWSSTTP